MSAKSLPPPFSAIILAGGQSSRMGQDKALVSIGTQTLLQYVCAVAQQCANSVYVVTPWIERYQDLLSKTTATPVHFVREQFLSETDTQHGPLVGFAQGLTHILQAEPSQAEPSQTEWVLLLACDLPHLQAEILQGWAARLPTVDAATIALLPRNPNGWWEPLCGFYRRRCLPELEQFIAAGGRSFQRWLSQQGVQALPLPDPQLVWNCNTPEDLTAFCSRSQTDP